MVPVINYVYQPWFVRIMRADGAARNDDSV